MSAGQTSAHPPANRPSGNPMALQSGAPTAERLTITSAVRE
jgi:hypothetical protein